MPKPSLLFGWLSTTYAKTDPPGSLKTSGFNVDDVLPFSYMNHWLNGLKQWVDDYLNVLESESLTWTVLQTFQKPLVLGLTALQADALTERIKINVAAAAVSARTEVLKGLGVATPFGEVHFYIPNVGDSTLSFEVVLNAEWNGTAWARKVSGVHSAILRFDDGRLRAYRHLSSSTSTWADTYGVVDTWDKVIGELGVLGFTSLIGGALSVADGASITGTLVVSALSTLASLYVSGASTFVGAAKVNGGITADTGIDVVVNVPTGRQAIVNGDLTATTGMNRSEALAHFDNFGGVGPSLCQFAPIGLTAPGTQLYRFLNGKLTGVYVAMSVSSAVLTVVVRKYHLGSPTTLATVTNVAGVATARVVIDAAYEADDYLTVEVSGGASGNDISVLLRMKE